MARFSVTLVGTSKATLVESHNDYHAVAEASGCRVQEVCLPIWRSGRVSKWGEQDYRERCYMPRDDSGRQWLVRDAHAT